jgi:hypothetical protein
MKLFRIILFFLISSCSDNGYKTAINFYKNNRYEFLKSGLVNLNFESRVGYYEQDTNRTVIFRVIVTDLENIVVIGDLKYFNLIYKISTDNIQNIDRIEFKLQNNIWVGIIDSTTKITQLNKTGLEYFLDLDKFRNRWQISMIYKYDSTITIGFYDKENQLIYKGSRILDINTNRIEKLDSLWTYEKLKKVYD